MADAANDPKLRVFLWTKPRSLGTVFLKCMSFLDGVQIIKEPFVGADMFGPDRFDANDNILIDVLSKGLSPGADPEVKAFSTTTAYDGSTASISWTKQMLESPFPGKTFVFVHDQAFCLREDYTRLPRGYRHTFLIRNPYRQLPSWKKTMGKIAPSVPFTKLPELMVPSKLGYGELYDLLQYILKNSEESPIIVDADDLQANPKSILSQYCNLLGIEFKESMLKWEAGDKVVDTWLSTEMLLKGSKLDAGGYYEDALKSAEFHPPSELPARDQIDDELLPLIDQCMPIYQKMYSMRIRP